MNYFTIANIIATPPSDGLLHPPTPVGRENECCAVNLASLGRNHFRPQAITEPQTPRTTQTKPPTSPTGGYTQDFTTVR